MMDSLAYRNDAAIVFRRLIRSLPRRRGIMGVATCDKGLPAMMMALAAMRDLPAFRHEQAKQSRGRSKELQPKRILAESLGAPHSVLRDQL